MKRICCALLVPILLAAAPATKPTTRPNASEQQIVDEKLHFRFAVPKAWKQVKQQTDASLYVFDLPATGESRRATPTFIVVAQAADGDDLAAVRDRLKARIVEKNPEAKFSTDAAATVAGHDGWKFEYGTSLNQTVTDKQSGKSHAEKVAVKVRDEVVVIDGRAFEFILTSDEKGLPIRARLVDTAIATLDVQPQ